MKLVIGLGNPGEQYARTRHNVGWRVIDALARDFDIELREEKKFQAAVAKHGDVLLCKPLTFMNNSGDAVRRVAEYYGVHAADILVVYDDIAIPFGVIRLRSTGSSGGHNGMQSIIQMLGTPDIPRLRIGILGEHPSDDLAQYVLHPFSRTEEAVLPEISSAAAAAVERVCASGVQTQDHVDIAVLDQTIKKV